MYAIRHLLFVVLFSAASASGALAQEAVGSITAGSGEIVVIGASGEEQPATVGTPIQQYDTIYVGEGGDATVTFVDDTILALSGGSALTIDELVYDPGNQASSGLFTLVGGTLALVSGDILKTGDMMVTTPVSTIGIRGTAVLIDAGTRISRDAFGNFRVTTTGADGESVTLVVSPDGTLGTVVVRNTLTGESTILSTFGGTVSTSGGLLQVRSNLTVSQLADKFGPLLQALQNATGMNLGDPDNINEATDLQQAIQDVLDLIEENPNQDASPD